MIGLHSLLLVICATLVITTNADLISDLKKQNVTLLAPGDTGYANASTAFNLRFTFNPAVITFPNNAQDVSSVVKIGQSYNHKVVARGGGHSYIANGLGGKDGVVMLDMKNINEVSVDPNSFVATVGSGNRLGNVALGLNDAGRAIPHGTCPYVGVGGHSGHGGFGFTSRMWGLNLDAIQSIQVVLANGTIVDANATTNPDLFFALRGSSSSFGIVTSIQYKTHPAPPSATIFEYHWNLSAADAAAAADQFQGLFTNVPQEFGPEMLIRRGSSKGYVDFGLFGGWYAPADQFDKVIAPFLSKLPTPSNQSVSPVTYINSIGILGGLEGGRINMTGIPDIPDTFYAKSLMTPEASPISTAALNAFMTYLANDGFTANTDWFVGIELFGGPNSAINSVPLDATAFAHRSSLFTIQFYTSAPGNKPPFPQEGFSFLDGIVDSILKNEPSDWDYGAHLNYIDNRLDNWQKLYYGPHYPRLKTLKDQYDPKDTFDFPLAVEE